MMKRYEVYWTKEATFDLEEIVNYIAHDRLPAAKSIYKKIRTKCRELDAYPQRCRRVPELVDAGIDNYREIILAPYRVIFKLTDSILYIIAVVDGRRDVETFIFNRLLRNNGE